MQASSITSTSSTNSNHYEIILGDNYLKVVANAQSHSLAMQAVQAIKTEFGHLYQAHARPIEHHPASIAQEKPPQSVEPPQAIESKLSPPEQ